MNKKVAVKFFNIGDAFILDDHTYIVCIKTEKHVYAADQEDGAVVSFSKDILVEVV